ncbi:transmembrane reductase CYB561D2 [Helicoverpa armigera]|uniref:ascorbate ferrireductase (transmembrane) n=1 Tax=Helicoverpa armigera TaxID=29058 RepID=A0A2W1C0Z7_HELAM|nr:hypothetical protein B5X24_HaOG202997 [Helicoverpa armigera]
MSSSMFTYEENNIVKTILSGCNVLVNFLMGVIVALPLLFAVVKDFNEPSAPDNIIMLHILLCVPGYQLLMSHSFLSLCPYNSWSSTLKKANQRRAHWILQLLASGMAISGSIIIMINKDTNFTTTHGRLGLSALIFTMLNLITGVPTLFAHSLKRFIPKSVFKLIHIILGITAFALATSCLCHGYNKESFRTWTNDRVTSGIIAFTVIFTFLMLVNPLITLGKKVYRLIEEYRMSY